MSKPKLESETITAREGPRDLAKLSFGGGSLCAAMMPPEREMARLPSIPAPVITANTLPTIPWDALDGGVVQAWMYFRAVYEKQRSEAFLWWHWDVDAGRYVMVVPAFYVASSSGLTYPASMLFCDTCRVGVLSGGNRCPHCGTTALKNLQAVGTSHSHAAFSPFHSGTDDRHEADATGFHITFGHLDRELPIAGSFVFAKNATRFATAWTDHFALDRSEALNRRIKLWLSVVSSPAAAIEKFSVVDKKTKKATLFECTDKRHADLWVASRTDGADFEVVQTQQSAIRTATEPVSLRRVARSVEAANNETVDLDRLTQRRPKAEPRTAPRRQEAGVSNTLMALVEALPDSLLIVGCYDIVASIVDTKGESELPDPIKEELDSIDVDDRGWRVVVDEFVNEFSPETMTARERGERVADELFQVLDHFEGDHDSLKSIINTLVGT